MSNTDDRPTDPGLTPPAREELKPPRERSPLPVQRGFPMGMAYALPPWLIRIADHWQWYAIALLIIGSGCCGGLWWLAERVINAFIVS